MTRPSSVISVLNSCGQPPTGDALPLTTTTWAPSPSLASNLPMVAPSRVDRQQLSELAGVARSEPEVSGFFRQLRGHPLDCQAFHAFSQA